MPNQPQPTITIKKNKGDILSFGTEDGNIAIFTFKDGNLNLLI